MLPLELLPFMVLEFECYRYTVRQTIARFQLKATRFLKGSLQSCRVKSMMRRFPHPFCSLHTRTSTSGKAVSALYITDGLPQNISPGDQK